MWKAVPMACEAEEQAEAMEKDGPWMPRSMVIWLTCPLGMARGTVKGCGRGALSA